MVRSHSASRITGAIFMTKILLAAGISVLFMIPACTKEVPKEFRNTDKDISKKEMPDDPIHNNLKQGSDRTSESDSKQDQEKADKLTTDADDADAKYQKSKSDADKKEAVEKEMT